MPQVDTTALDSGGVPSPSLFNHHPRLIDARDMPRCRQVRQALNNHTGSETHLQHPVVWSDLKEATDPGAAISIHARHDNATQPSQGTLRAAKHAHQNVSHDTHRWPGIAGERRDFEPGPHAEEDRLGVARVESLGVAFLLSSPGSMRSNCSACLLRSAANSINALFTENSLASF